MGADAPSRPRPEDVPAVRALAERIVEAARPAAQAKGYALTVHGSLARDVDLCAVPWTDDAAPVGELVKAIQAAVSTALGAPWYRSKPGPKPHGRLAFTLYGHNVVVGPGGAFPFIDLSVMPRRRRHATPR